MPTGTLPPPKTMEAILFDDDDEGWEDMPVIREDALASGLDDEDRRKYHYVAPANKAHNSTIGAANATGNLIDFDDWGNEWRSKIDQNESEYTRLRVNDEDDADEVHLRTKYLFDEDKAMTPLSQMQATKDLLTEAQRIAYVGVCALACQEMSNDLRITKSKELKAAVQSMDLWAMKILGRLYYHMELETQEQKMIESLASHGVTSMDLVPSLMTTHTVANPEYDPAEAEKLAQGRMETSDIIFDAADDPQSPENASPKTPTRSPTTAVPKSPTTPETPFQTTKKVLAPTAPTVIPGVSTSLSSTDKNVTLDIRWTVLCDLFLILIADSVYDARSRVLLENVAMKLGLGWLDVVKFEHRVTEALEIQEDVDNLEQKGVIEGRQKAARKRRYVMMGLATLGGGLVIGLSAGLLAPVIGAGLGAAFTTIGIGGTTGFLAGTGGAAMITTGGVLTGSSIAAKGMARRTKQVGTFELLPLHNNKRVNCIITVPGFMTGPQDDVRLPFSVLDPIVGDVFSVLWEPEMMGEMGSALKILTTEVLTQIGQTVLQATVMTALMSALQWPVLLTKLGYLIDNPWSNALDRAKAAGGVLADVLINRHVGVRPITLIGFSLGARAIFYCLLELSKQKAMGIVQDVFMLGATVTAPTKAWHEARSVVAGRFVNGFARNDWVLNYLFRATSGGLNTVAGLRPVHNVPGLENVDVTDKIAGHMSYRTFMPLILDQLGFPVSADYFDEPDEPDMTQDRMIVREGEESSKKKGWFSRERGKKSSTPTKSVSRPPSVSTFHRTKMPAASDDDLPERTERSPPTSPAPGSASEAGESTASLPLRAGFDFEAIKAVIGKESLDPAALKVPGAMTQVEAPPRHEPMFRTASAPPLPVPGPSSPSSDPFATPVLGSADLPPLPPKNKSDLSSAFARSVSMNNVLPNEPEDDENMTEDESSGSYTAYTSSPLRARFGTSSSPTSAIPTLAFGSVDGSVWAPDPPTPDAFSSFGNHSNRPIPAHSTLPPTIGTRNPASSSTISLSFGGRNGAVYSPPLVVPPPPDNPFASPTTTLTFGGVDGSISQADRDPWDTTSRAKKTVPSSVTFNSNPWQS